VLMLCWPQWKTHQPMSHRALANFTGDKLIYIGQKAGGVTGTAKFHAMLERDWQLVTRHRLLNWKGIEDSVYFYRRKC
jgi:hypothetical protein